MRLYCTCGSLIINGKCSNKKCETLEFELDILDLQNETNSYCINEKIRKKVKKFDGFIPMLPQYDNLLSGLDDDDTYDTKINISTELKALRAFKIPLNISVGIRVKNDDDGIDRIAFIKVQEASLKEARGKIDRITPYMVKIELYYPYVDQGYTTYLGSFDENKWQVVSKFKPVNPQEDLTHALNSIGLQYTLSKNWSVYIKDEDDVIGMRMMIGRNKAREIFKLRDIEDGKQRRTALRHIVNSHSRKISDEMEIDVLKHLRGAMEFDWEDLKCTIIPSLKEIRSIEKLKSEKQLK
jgi:hypothetical protein